MQVRMRARRGEAEKWLTDVALSHDSDECLLWPFGNFGPGYGAYRKGAAHAEVCRRVHGERPEGHEAAHSCGNRRCVAPRHLRWATRAENQADRIAHGTDWRGERHGNSKLTRKSVRAIRADSRPSRAVAADHDISPRHVRKVRAGVAWGHVK